MILTFNPRKFIYYFALGLAFVLPLSRAGVSLFSGLLLLTWIIEGDFKNKYKHIKQEPTLLAMLALFAYMVITLFWSENLKDGENNLRNFYYYFPIAFIFFTSLKKESVASIISAFIFGMFISELISYGLYFELIHKEGCGPDDPSPFMHHVEYSIFLAITALFIINQIFYAHLTWIRRAILGLFFITVVSNLFINIGRTGEISFLVALFALILSHMRLSFKSITIATGTVGMILLLVYSFSPVVQTRIQDFKNDIRQMQTGTNFDSSLGGRYAMNIVGFDIIKEAPFFGSGIGDDDDLFMQRVQEGAFQQFRFLEKYADFHSLYIQTLVRGGIVGLIFLLLIFVTLNISAKKDDKAKHMAVILTVIFLLSAFVDALIIRQFMMVLFSFLLGLILTQSRQEER